MGKYLNAGQGDPLERRNTRLCVWERTKYRKKQIWQISSIIKIPAWYQSLGDMERSESYQLSLKVSFLDIWTSARRKLLLALLHAFTWKCQFKPSKRLCHLWGTYSKDFANIFEFRSKSKEKMYQCWKMHVVHVHLNIERQDIFMVEPKLGSAENKRMGTTPAVT